MADFNAKFLPKQVVAISPDDRGFSFAEGLDEVIRSYGGRLWGLKAQLDRTWSPGPVTRGLQPSFQAAGRTL